MKFFAPNNAIFAKKLENELDELCSYASRITSTRADYVLPDVMDQITVVFNDVDKPFVRDTIAGLKNYIKRLFGKYDKRNDVGAQKVIDILKYLDGINEDCDRDVCSEAIYCLLLKNNEFDDDEDVKKDIERLKRRLLTAHHGYNVSGTYNHATKTITLFTQNIQDDFEDYLSVFAHEFFHAVHLFMIDRRTRCQYFNKYYQTVVLESLATYFQIEYLDLRGYFAKSTEVRHDAVRYSPVFYPYGGCRYLFGHVSFEDVLGNSFYDFESALRRLVNPYDAEIIMLMHNPNVWNLDSSADDSVKYGNKRGEYTYNGQIYEKGKLVLAIINDYVKMNKPTLYQLAKAFPDCLQGSNMGVVQLLDDVKNYHSNWIGPLRKFFIDEPIIVEGKEVIVCNQWGTDNIYNFIVNAMKLGYIISTV